MGSTEIQLVSSCRRQKALTGKNIELLEELRLPEAQLNAGAGVCNNDARAALVLARINALK